MLCDTVHSENILDTRVRIEVNNLKKKKGKKSQHCLIYRANVVLDAILCGTCVQALHRCRILIELPF